MKRYYLAYGSNLNIEQMKHRCPTAKVVTTSWIENCQLVFKGSKTGSYLTIESKKGAKVPVAVWEVDEACERSLDRYEGYPVFYTKKELPNNCFFYEMREDAEYGIPSEYYMKVCKEGYETFGFDKKYLTEALERSWKNYGN